MNIFVTGGLALLSALSFNTIDAAERWSEQRDQFAPKINAKLLFASTYGGSGDQGIRGLRKLVFAKAKFLQGIKKDLASK